VGGGKGNHETGHVRIGKVEEWVETALKKKIRRSWRGETDERVSNSPLGQRGGPGAGGALRRTRKRRPAGIGGVIGGGKYLAAG